MKIAMSSLLFSQKPLADALRSIERLGIRYVDVGALQGWCHIQPADLMKNPESESRALRHLLNETQLEVVALNAGIHAPELDQWRALVALAHQFDVGVITLPTRRSGTRLVQEVERLQRLVEIAGRQGVRLGVETHIGTLTEDPETALALVHSVPGLGLTLDVSHYYCNSFEEAAEVLIPFVYHVHMRDGGRGSDNIQLPMGRGLVDFAHWFALLRNAQYQGNVTVEYIDLGGIQFDPTESAIECYRLCQTMREGFPL